MVSLALGAFLPPRFVAGSWIDTIVPAWWRSHCAHLLSLRLLTESWIDNRVPAGLHFALGVCLITETSHWQLDDTVVPNFVSHRAYLLSWRLIASRETDPMVPAWFVLHWVRFLPPRFVTGSCCWVRARARARAPGSRHGVQGHGPGVSCQGVHGVHGPGVSCQGP